MIGNYENVIPLLEEFIAVGEKYKYPVSARGKSFNVIFTWQIRPI